MRNRRRVMSSAIEARVFTSLDLGQSKYPFLTAARFAVDAASDCLRGMDSGVGNVDTDTARTTSGADHVRLTKFTDYSLRVLLLAASRRDGDRLTIEEVAETFAISRGHVKKVVLHLSQAGFLTGTRGRTGGLALARPPDTINIGEVIRATEPDFGLFECYLPGNACRITRGCRLASIGNRALAAFLAAFDACTLEDALVSDILLEGDAPTDTQQPLRGPHLPPVRPRAPGSG